MNVVSAVFSADSAAYTVIERVEPGDYRPRRLNVDGTTGAGTKIEAYEIPELHGYSPGGEYLLYAYRTDRGEPTRWAGSLAVILGAAGQKVSSIENNDLNPHGVGENFGWFDSEAFPRVYSGVGDVELQRVRATDGVTEKAMDWLDGLGSVSFGFSEGLPDTAADQGF